MNFKTLHDANVKGKRVLVRAGLNVPIKDGRVIDDFRIRRVAPTIDYLLKNQAKVIIVAHLGRPQETDQIWDEKLSMRPIAEKLAEFLGRKLVVMEKDQSKLPDYDVPRVNFLQQNILEIDLSATLAAIKPGELAFLENIRFYPEELSADTKFAKLLASFADIYVNEAFAVSHRDQASVSAVPKFLPSFAGFDLVNEVAALEKVRDHPKPPVVAMLGGVKFATKAMALLNLAKKTDWFLLGGGLANLLLKLMGFEIGKSVYDKESLELGKQVLRDYKPKLKFPLDVVVSNNPEGRPEAVKVDQVRSSQMILDIGPETITEYSRILKTGKTLVWSGPLGYFEAKPFSHGTFALGQLFSSRASSSIFGVAGGGETLEVIRQRKLEEGIDFVSTGGGAMLAFLAGEQMPGLEALENSQ